MPAEFFKKEAKPNLFKRKTLFKYKKTERKLKKEPPRRKFKARKVTWWTIFCTTFLFPIILKVVRAANEIGGQHAPPTIMAPDTGAVAGAAVAGGAAAVGVAGVGIVAGAAAAAGSAGMAAVLGNIIGWSTTVGGNVVLTGVGGAAFLGITPLGWILIGVAILAIAVLLALSMMGVISCDSCGSCGGQQSVAGAPPTSQNTGSVSSGANTQAAGG